MLGVLLAPHEVSLGSGHLIFVVLWSNFLHFLGGGHMWGVGVYIENGGWGISLRVHVRFVEGFVKWLF